MGNSLESFDGGCCMFIEEKENRSEGPVQPADGDKSSHRGSYVGSAKSRRLEHVQYLGHDQQLFPGSEPNSCPPAAAYFRDNEIDLPYGFVKEFRSERATFYGNSVDSGQHGCYNSGPANPESDQLMETPR